MKRFLAIASAAFLTAGLIGWAALAWGQPNRDMQAWAADLPADLPSVGPITPPVPPPVAPVPASPALAIPGAPVHVDSLVIPTSLDRELKKPALTPPAPATFPAPAPATPPSLPQPAALTAAPAPAPTPSATPTAAPTAAPIAAPIAAPKLVPPPVPPAAPIPAPPKPAPSSPSLAREPAREGAATMTPPTPLMVPGSLPPTGERPAPAAAPQTPATHEPIVDAGSAAENRSGRQEPSVRLEWMGSPSAKVGQTSTYSLLVRNTCTIPVQQVLVRVRVPAGLRCMDTDPKAVMEGNVLVWELGTLQPRQEQTLHMKLLAEQKGDVSPQAWVTFTGSSLLRIKVREPKLVVHTQGPPKVLIGETATIVLAIANPGDGPAEQVKVHALLSEGLESARGPKVDFDIGNLAAGETRNVTVQCVTKAGGAQKCDVVAEADGGLNARETATLSVTTPRLDLQMMGPGLRYLGRKALYTLRVGNPGDAPASNVTISDVVPEGFKVLAASDGGRHDASTRTVSWFLGELGPGQSHEVKLEVQAVNPGEFKHKGAAVAARGLSASSELTTRVDGLSALLLEMVDTEDPIEVGSDTGYQVRITNTGSKVETDIKLVATIPDRMEFRGATGPVRFHEEGKIIVFEPIESLAPKAEAAFRINVKAADPGTVRFKIQLTSTNLTEPVIKMEATRIYADAPEVKSSH